MYRPLLTTLGLLLALLAGWLCLPTTGHADGSAAAPSTAPATMPAHIADFARRMHQVELAGQFSTGDDARPAGNENYQISSARWLGGESWLIFARVRYGQRDVTLPVPVQVRFAGDTPVVCLDEVRLPLLGTYSARVVFHGDRYAGTWSGGKSGGHLWGTIRPLPATRPVEGRP